MFIIRNDNIGRNLLKEWIESYDPQQWYKLDNKWILHGIFAGETYKQGYYYKYLKYTSILNYHVFQSTLHNITENTFSLHFAGYYKNDIDEYCTKFLV